MGDSITAEPGTGFMQKITPFLWFNSDAEQGVKFYTSIFKKSKVASVTLSVQKPHCKQH